MTIPGITDKTMDSEIDRVFVLYAGMAVGVSGADRFGVAESCAYGCLHAGNEMV
jgi:hypothetical protein